MSLWKMLAAMASGVLRSAGIAKENEDANTTGKDDAVGEALVFAADLLDALVHDKPLPKAPASLR